MCFLIRRQPNNIVRAGHSPPATAPLPYCGFIATSPTLSGYFAVMPL